MKTIALFAGLLISQFAFSQNFISENKLWNVRDEFWGSVNTWIYKIGGDTVINSVNYKKLWSTTDSTMDNLWLEGLIREESNVVYIKNYFEDDEGVLYDFNLEVGDTTYIVNEYCFDMQVVIADIDTVDYFGISRKRWIIEGWPEEYWIEGIGSLWGPVHTKYPDCIWDVWFELLCFHENDTLAYIIPGEDDCFQTSIGIGEEADEGHLVIKPNPVKSGQSFIIQSEKEIKEVEIYNPEGVLINQFLFDNKQSVSISSYQLNTGLYLARIRTKDNHVVSRKIIIK